MTIRLIAVVLSILFAYNVSAQKVDSGGSTATDTTRDTFRPETHEVTFPLPGQLLPQQESRSVSPGGLLRVPETTDAITDAVTIPRTSYPVLRLPIESYTTTATCERCSPETYLAGGRYASVFLLVFAGDTTDVPKACVYAWTTRSVSRNADAPPPWNIGGESPQRACGEPGEWPWITGDGNAASGWIVVPVMWELIRDSKGQYVLDAHMRVAVYLTPRACGIPVARDPQCHGRTLLEKTDVSLIPTVPTATVYKRWKVVH